MRISARNQLPGTVQDVKPGTYRGWAEGAGVRRSRRATGVACRPCDSAYRNIVTVAGGAALR